MFPEFGYVALPPGLLAPVLCVISSEPQPLPLTSSLYVVVEDP